MAEYVIFTDSTNDLPPALMAENQVGLLPMEIVIGEERLTFRHDWNDERIAAFYDRLRQGEVAVTSQIAPAEYEAAFAPVLASGRDILYVCFSSGLSGTIQSAMLAAETLRETYPDRTVRCVDSLGATFGEGLAVYNAIRLKNDGVSLEDNARWLEEHVRNFAHWFTVEDLMYLRRGGRISATTAVLGAALQIRPVMHMDDEGHLISMDKAHGRKASLRALAKKLADTIVNPEEQVVYISHGGSPKDAEFLAQRVRESAPVKDVFVWPLSPVIGAHSGPGTIALFFEATGR